MVSDIGNNGKLKFVWLVFLLCCTGKGSWRDGGGGRHPWLEMMIGHGKFPRQEERPLHHTDMSAPFAAHRRSVGNRKMASSVWIAWINLPGCTGGRVSQMLLVVDGDHQPRSLWQINHPPSSASSSLSHMLQPFHNNSTFTNPQTSWFSPINRFAEHKLSDQHLASKNKNIL